MKISLIESDKGENYVEFSRRVKGMTIPRWAVFATMHLSKAVTTPSQLRMVYWSNVPPKDIFENDEYDPISIYQIRPCPKDEWLPYQRHRQRIKEVWS